VSRCYVLIVATAMGLAGCNDATPIGPAPSGLGAPNKAIGQVTPARVQTFDDALLTIADREPTFAGAWIANGQLQVALTRPGASDAAIRSAILGAFPNSRAATAPMNVRWAQYSFRQLFDWGTHLAHAFEIPGVVSTDIDEVHNALTIGVSSDAVRPVVGKWLEQLGVPAAAIRTELQNIPVTLSGSLGGEVRQIIGGVHLDAPPTGKWCTLGFNTRIAGVASFVTNGHCSNSFGVPNDGTNYWQAYRSVPADLAGAEGVEAHLFSMATDSRCPAPTNLCKWSDFATGTYTVSMAPQQAMGYFARATTRTRFDSNLVINATNPALAIRNKVLFPFVGDTVDKIGARTGWTFGPVTASCKTETVNVDGQYYYFVCAHEANMGVNNGDSGSGIFVYGVAGDTASLAGQLFAGYLSNGSLYTMAVFAPLNNIQSEFGLVPATIWGN
jgi:hypothetical protein